MVDRGKMMALHNAGWTNKKIADEMACGEASVSTIIKLIKEKAEGEKRYGRIKITD